MIIGIERKNITYLVSFCLLFIIFSVCIFYSSKDSFEMLNKNLGNTILVDNESDNLPNDYQDNGIFSDYYDLAYNKLNELSLEEKIAQLLLVRYSSDNVEELQKKYDFGGFVFYENDFKNKTKRKYRI